MHILSIEERPVSIASGIRNAYVSFANMTVSVVKVSIDVEGDGRPVVGYGFNSNGRYAQSGLLNERFIPRLLASDPASLLEDGALSPHKAWDVMMRDEKPGGHGERSVAVGVLDMALWDLAGKLEHKPLATLLAERYGKGEPGQKVAVYAAGGYYHESKSLDTLREEMRGYLAQGFTTVKMKIGGATLGEDIKRIEAVLDLVGDPARLAVDANGRLNLREALHFAAALEPYGLRWFEEAGDPLDYALQAALSEDYAPPLATGENLFSHQDVRNLLRYARLRPDRDVLQMDPVLSYGLVEYLRMLEVLSTHGWSRERCIPHGGHAFALHIAAGLGLGGNEAYPEVFAPFGSFPESTPVENGTVSLADAPGIGFEANEKLYDLFTRTFEARA